MLLVGEGVMQAFLPQYRVEGILGEGATAVVYSAVNVENGDQVAIKWLRAGVLHDDWTARFAREISIVQSLSHPHLVAVLDQGEVDGRPYAVMPHLLGETLRARLAREIQLPFDDVVRIASQVASAIDYAHDRGVLHRDIKPENIMLSESSQSDTRSFVLDFGIARVLDEIAGESITRTGVAVGTPHYMSPEQAAADPHIDGRTDVYSLACVVYEMLAGEPPFTGATMQAVRARQMLDVPGRVRVVRPDLPENVDRALQRGLAKAPADRPPSCEAFVKELTQSITQSSGSIALGRDPRSDESRVSASLSRSIVGSARGRIAALLIVGVLVALAAMFLVNEDTPVAPLTPQWLLISRVEASSNERELAAAVEELLRSEFARSPQLALVSTNQVRQALRAALLPDTTVLTAARAREVALRSSVKLILTSTVHRVDANRVALTATLLRADSLQTIATKAVVSSVEGDELLVQISRIVRELRTAAGEAAVAAPDGSRHELVSTPSFAAFQLYSDAQTAQLQGKIDASIHLARQALEADSAFAAAWALLATNFAVARQPDSASHAFAQAMRYAERLAPPEADRLRGDAAFHTAHDFEQATQWYRRFLDQRPLSVPGWNNLALYLSALGRHEEALHAFERSATIDPFLLGPRPVELLNMSAELVVGGHLDSASKLARKLRGADSTFMQLMMLSASNRWDSLATIGERLMQSDATESWVRLSAVLSASSARMALGDSARSAEILDRFIATSTGAPLRSYLHARLLLDLVRDAAPSWSLPSAVLRDTSAGGQFVRAVYAAQRGDVTTAKRALTALRSRGAVTARSLGAGLIYLDALVAMHTRGTTTGDSLSGELERNLVAAATAGEHDPLSVDRPSGVALRWLAMRWFERHGAGDKGSQMRDLMLRPTGMATSHYALRGFVARTRM